MVYASYLYLTDVILIIDVICCAGTDSNPGSDGEAKASVFGAARPREEVLRQRGVVEWHPEVSRVWEKKALILSNFGASTCAHGRRWRCFANTALCYTFLWPNQTGFSPAL